MWMGIVVLCTFGLAALALLYLAVQGARRRQWHIAASMLVPAVVLGGTIVMMVAPVIRIELFGHPDLEALPEHARRVAAAELDGLYRGNTHAGTAYDEDDGAWLVFERSHRDDGGLLGSSGPEDDPTDNTLRGSWSVEGDRVCLRYGNDTRCLGVFLLDGEYVEVNRRDEIETYFRVATPPGEDRGGA